jgi:hypothetical protein
VTAHSVTGEQEHTSRTGRKPDIELMQGGFEVSHVSKRVAMGTCGLRKR